MCLNMIELGGKICVVLRQFVTWEWRYIVLLYGRFSALITNASFEEKISAEFEWNWFQSVLVSHNSTVWIHGCTLHFEGKNVLNGWKCYVTVQRLNICFWKIFLDELTSGGKLFIRILCFIPFKFNHVCLNICYKCCKTSIHVCVLFLHHFMFCKKYIFGSLS